jgi:hypothetical protein
VVELLPVLDMLFTEGVSNSELSSELDRVDEDQLAYPAADVVIVPESTVLSSGLYLVLVALIDTFGIS